LRQAQQAAAFLGLTAAIICVVHIIFSCANETMKSGNVNGNALSVSDDGRKKR
jgi:hypothetical protein